MNRHCPVLTGKRLKLRPLAITDEEALFRCWSHPEVASMLGVPILSSVEQAGALIEQLLGLEEEEECMRWSIVLHDGEVIGSCGFNSWQLQGAFRGELGCEITPDFWGKGYMSEALRLVLDYGFQNLGLNRIEALCHPKNMRAERLFTSLGFQQEGVLRQYRHTLSGFQDVVMYALLHSSHT